MGKSSPNPYSGTNVITYSAGEISGTVLGRVITDKKFTIMDATLNPQNQNPSMPLEGMSEKSELMQVFERQVNDIYWAYKDLLKAILESDESES